MDNLSIQKNDNKYLIIIGILSVAIPVVVAILLFIPQTGKLGDLDVSFLPHLNAVLNSATALALFAGFLAIKNDKKGVHRTFMMTAFTLSSIFLISYVIYHFQGTQTKFGDMNHDGLLSDAELAGIGGLRYFYLGVLLTHILLAIAVVPLVLLAVYFAFSKQFDRHKKTVKWTFPVWMYVAITGVLVYLMISPYYGS